MLIQCNHCGAPLDVSAGKRTVKCRYCEMATRVNQTTQIAAVTPADWKPPKTWTPPEEAAAPSTPLRYHRRVWPSYVAAGGLVLIVTGVSAVSMLLARQDGSGGSTGLLGVGGEDVVSPDQVAAITDLAVDRATLAAALGVETPDPEWGVSVDLEGSRWDRITFDWDESEPNHVSHVAITGAELAPGGAAVRSILRAALGRRATPNESGAMNTHFRGTAITMGADDEHLIIHTSPESSPHWQRQTQLAWDLVRAAAFGGTPALDDTARRDYLGVGHPPSHLAALDVTTDVDASEAAVMALLPTAERDGASFSARIDHPWLDRVDLVWENAPAGKLETVRLPPWERTHMEALATCLTPVLGPPEVQVVNHVENERAWTWGTAWNNDSARVHWGLSFGVAAGRGEPRTQAQFAAILRRLDTCAAP